MPDTTPKTRTVGMQTVLFKCPRRIIIFLLVGSIAPLGVVPSLPEMGWPPKIAWILLGLSIFIFLYALTLLPCRLTISEEGVHQKLFFTESMVRWEDMEEWRHSMNGPEFETGELRAQTMNKWHSQFWVRDKSGKKHYFKSWLVAGRKSKQLADIMRAHGIQGG